MTEGAFLQAASADRIANRIARLAEFVELDRPFTRRAFSAEYVAARAWLAEEFRREGLVCGVDAGANLVGRTGTTSSLRPIVLGSHIDTVVGGGRYDGVAGVICALEVASALRERDHDLRHPLWVVDFLSEEPSDYGASCVGSRAMAGTLTSAMLAGRNPAGESLAEAISRMGGDPTRIGAPLITEPLGAFLELHVEQGRRLEDAAVPIGIVTGIVAVRRARWTFHGEASHAGTTSMPERRDALVAAARFVEAVHIEALRRSTSEAFVATIGRFLVEPNAANVVPNRVELVVESRALDERSLDDFSTYTQDVSTAILEALRVEAIHETISTAPAAACDEAVRGALQRAARERGLGTLELASGAGHDAMQMALLAPMGMLFVPSRGGLSHTPSEHTDIEDLVAGADVLLGAVLELDRVTA